MIQHNLIVVVCLELCFAMFCAACLTFQNIWMDIGYSWKWIIPPEQEQEPEFQFWLVGPGYILPNSGSCIREPYSAFSNSWKIPELEY